MKKVYTSLLALSFVMAGMAQGSITEASNTITQDFDGIGASQTATLPANWRVSLNALLVRTVDAYSSAGTSTAQRAGDNMSTTAPNGIYNYGAGDPTTATDRAVGGLSSGSNSKSVNLYYALKNEGASDINDFTISYDIEKYRNGSNTAGFSVTFWYSSDGSTWVQAPGTFTASFAAGTDNSGGAPAPSATNSISNQTLNVSVPAGATLYFAWNYSVTTGTITSNAIALGVDNVSIKANYPNPLPVKLSGFNITHRNNSILLNWTALNETDMVSYEIQKSRDGRTFEPIGSINARNGQFSQYNYLDGSPATGMNYYRLRQVSRTGEYSFSQVLRLQTGAGAPDVSVISNPVRGGVLNLQLTNLDKGKYFVRLMNSVGQLVFSRSMDYDGGSSTQSIDLPAGTVKGNYYLQMTNGKQQFSRQIMID